MAGASIQQMADRVADLMEDRLKIPGAGLSEKLKAGGRKLPRKIRASAGLLAEASVAARNPKRLMQLNQEAIAKAYDDCVRYLGRLNARQRRVGAVLDFGASVAFALLIVAVLTFAVLRWRGFI